MPEENAIAPERKENILLWIFNVVMGALVTVGTSFSIATLNQIQESDRAIVRLETKLATLEKTLEGSRLTNQEVMVLRSQVGELSRRIEILETNK